MNINKQKQILFLIIIVIVAVLVWMMYIRGGSNNPAPKPNVQPVAEDTGKYTPKLNNTLETSVTVVNPNELPPGQPTQ
jgi:hypothetical protein